MNRRRSLNLLAAVVALASLRASPATQPTMLISQGRLGDAISLLEREVQLHPEAQAAWTELANIQDWLGDGPAAEVSLQKAVEHAPDPDTAADLWMRLAVLSLDDGEKAKSMAALDHAIALRPTCAKPAGMLCALFGQYSDSARYLKQSHLDDARWLVLSGNVALESGESAQAIETFTEAMNQAATPAMHRYCIERLVAAHRQQRTLDQLAMAWLSDKSLPAELWTPLAMLLQETGQIDELMAFWNRISHKGGEDHASAALANEVLNAARYAGKTEQAKAISLQMLCDHPRDAYWLRLTARAFCDWGDPEGASKLLAAELDRTEDVGQLHQLAIIGRDLGLRDFATAASIKLSRAGPDSQVDGLLIQAEIDRRHADFSHANALLTQAARFAENHPGDAVKVANALEFAGRVDDAIALLQKTASAGGYEQRLLWAALLAKQGRYREAMAQYELLRTEAPTESQRTQASLDLLDGAAAAGALPKLITDLQAKLTGGGTAQDVSDLTNALLRARRFPDALVLLKSTTLLDEKSRLNQMVILLLRAKRYTEAEPILQKLVEIDPASAVDHLEELAAAAIAEKDLPKADAAVTEIQKRLGSEPTGQQLLGNIFDRLDRPADAAACYEKLITADPTNGDAWLSWSAATTKAGEGLRARQRLQVLVHDAKTDALFATAVDGVFNQKPPSFVTASLRREALIRLISAPQSDLLWQVVADLSDELNDSDFARRAILASLPFDDEIRDQRLRDLLATTANHPAQLDTAIAVGHAMRFLNDLFPSQDYIDLGTQLLSAHRPAEALLILRRAVRETTEDRVTLRVVNLLAKFGQYDDALAIGVPLLPRHAFDPEIQSDFAGINEAAGNPASAFLNNLAIIKIKIEDTSPSSPDDELDEGKTLESAINSAVATADSPAQVDTLLKLLGNYARRSPRGFGKTSGKVKHSPMDLLRQAAFELHHPELIPADLETSDAGNIANGIRSRLDAGLFDLAGDFAIAHHAQSQLPPGAKWSDFLASDTAHNLMRFPDEAGYRLTRIRAAVAVNDAAQCEALAASFPLSENAEEETYAVLCKAALIAGDHPLANRLTLKFVSGVLEKARTSSDSVRMGRNSIQITIGNASRFLDASGQLELQTILEQEIEKSDNPALKRTEIQMLLQLASITGTAPRDAGAMAASMLDIKRDNANAIAGIFLLLQPVDQQKFLDAVMTTIPEAMKLDVYLTCIARANFPLDSTTVAVIEKGISKLPRQRKILWNAWCYNGAQSGQLGGIADAILAVVPEQGISVQSIAPTVACALALAESGRTTDADARAIIAIRHLAPWQEDTNIVNKEMGYFAYEQMKEGDPPPRAFLLQAALSALSPPARQALDDYFTTLAKGFTDQDRSKLIPAKLAWESLVRALVKQSLGEQREWLSLLTQSYQLNPGDPSVRKMYSEWLFGQGYNQQLLGAFPDVFTTAPGDHRIASLVTTAAGRLYRISDHDEENAGAPSAPPSLFALAAATGDRKTLTEALDRSLQFLRQSPFSTSSMSWQDPPLGGLQTEHVPKTVELLASDPAAMDVLLANWRFPSVRKLPWVKDLLKRGLSVGTIDRRKLIEQLEDREKRKTLDDADRDLIAVMADISDFEFPDLLVQDAWKAAAFRPTDDQFDLVAKLYDAAPASATQPSPAVIRHQQRMRFPHNVLTGGLLPDQWATSEIQEGDQSPADARLVLQKLMRIGSVTPQLMHFQIQAARLVAEQADWTNMRLHLRNAIEAWKLAPPPAVTTITPVTAPDFENVVPESFDSPANAAEFSDAIKAELQSVIARWPGDCDLVGAFAKVGGQLEKSGNLDRAKEFLQLGLTANRNLCDGEQTLCLADLAERLGEAELSEQLQFQCLRSGCLPVGRIATVIAKADPAIRPSLRTFVPGNLPKNVAPAE